MFMLASLMWKPLAMKARLMLQRMENCLPFCSTVSQGKGIWVECFKADREVVPLDPLLLSHLPVASPFAQLLEEQDSVTIWSHCGFTHLKVNPAVPRDLTVSEGVI